MRSEVGNESSANNSRKAGTPMPVFGKNSSAESQENNANEKQSTNPSNLQDQTMHMGKPDNISSCQSSFLD